MAMFSWKILFTMFRIKILASFWDKEKDKAYRMDMQRKIVNYLAQNAHDDDQREICEWLTRNLISALPYSFVDKYQKINVDIRFDDTYGGFYTIRNERKMYLRKSMKKKDAIAYIKSILWEQDDESPHKYIYSKRDIDGKVVADIGAAEGFWGLDIIDSVKKLYIFECDSEWVEALEHTFEPWSDKVQIVKKYVDVRDGENSISLDSFFANKSIDFIKADIEGFEVSMLVGAEKVLNKISKIILCAYHKQNAEADIKKILMKYDFAITTSKGYMIFLDDKDQHEPYVRRAMIYADK